MMQGKKIENAEEKKKKKKKTDFEKLFLEHISCTGEKNSF